MIYVFNAFAYQGAVVLYYFTIYVLYFEAVALISYGIYVEGKCEIRPILAFNEFGFCFLFSFFFQTGHFRDCHSFCFHENKAHTHTAARKVQKMRGQCE